VGNQYYFYHNDHLGTPQEMTAVNGAVVWSAKYASFGEASVEVEAVENNFRLPGQYFDSETGLHYNWHRYYDPEIGRYVRADPLDFASISNKDIIFQKLYKLSNYNTLPVYLFSSQLLEKNLY